MKSFLIAFVSFVGVAALIVIADSLIQIGVDYILDKQYENENATNTTTEDENEN